jgi:fibronectin-binding autotransporter adhesin
LPAGRFAVGAQAQSLTTEFLDGALDEVRVFTFAPGTFSTNDLLLNSSIVTTTSDSGPGSLRTTVANAPAGATITFAPNLSGQTILLTNGQITLATNVNIHGSTLASAIQLNGNGSNRVFYVNSGVTATLNSLIITNGQVSPGAGGDGLINYGTVTLNGCMVAGNGQQTSYAGGGIWNQGAMTVSNCTLANNSTRSGIGGGGIYNNGGTLTVDNSTLANNSGGRGGGIYNYSGTLTVNNSTFSINQAGVGGGIDNNGTLTVNNSTLANNSSGTYGGGIFNGGTLNLTNSIVSLNSGGDIYGSYSGSSNLVGVATINLAPLGNYGGPTQTMPPLPGSPAIDAGNDSVANFLATDQRGLPRLVGAHVDIGAVESGTPIPGYNYTVVTTTNDFTSELTNNGVALRAAVLYSAPGATITFAPNLSGQTILLTSGQIILSKNLTIDGSGLASAIQLNGNKQTRIFSVSSGVTATLNSLIITNGQVSPGEGGDGLINYGTVTLNGCMISGNGKQADNVSGGGLWNQGTITLNNCTLANNSSGFNGGGIFNNEGTLALNNCTLANNSSSGIYAGGGIYIYSGSLTMNNCTLANNSAYAGGGIYNEGTLNLTNSIVASNMNGDIKGTPNSFVNSLTNRPDIDLAPLGNYGGPTPTMPPLPGSPAIDAGNDAVTSFLATDQRGFPRKVGAHVDIGAVEFQMSPASFQVVTTNNDDTTGFDIGGVSLRKAVLYATNNATITFAPSLSGQTILLTNGQIVLTTNVTIDGSALANQVAISGNNASRIFLVNASVAATFNSLTIENGNDTSGVGGGGIIVSGSLTLTNCVVTNSTTTFEGGGIANIAGSLTVNNSTLAGNKGLYGGGIYSSGTLSVNDCTLASNSGSSFGGGVFTAGPMVANNATFANNRASSSSGGGISVIGGTLNLTNSIVSLNSGGDIYGSYSGSSNLVGVATINLAPLGNNGGPTMTMLPLSGSPAIDAGNDSVTSFLATDQRGSPRLSGAHVDIGAVEVQFVAANPNNPPVLQNAVWSATGGGTFQFAFTNVSGADFTALTATNVALPLTNWTVLGNIPEIAPGQYQFTDLGATNSPQRFYRVVSP